MSSTWRDLISDAMRKHGETFDDIIAYTPKDLDWDKEFDDGYGIAEGRPFTAWTPLRVYFPAVYDGAEWASSIPRDPCEEVTEHVGGGG